MPASDAQLAANRRNAALSTGPRTAEGKARSRANALKHGLTGGGVILAEEDADGVDRLEAELVGDLRPSGPMARLLVRRIAVSAVRMDRCVDQESAAISADVRHAGADHDDRRRADVEKMFDWIAAEPATHARRLRATPEGVDRLIRAWLDLGTDLDHPDRPRWDFSHWQRLENLTGRRPEDFPLSDAGIVSKAYWGDESYLDPEQARLDPAEKRAWIKDQLVAIIAAEVRALGALRETFDPELAAADRDEAGRRALFDPSRDAILARKYEAAAEGFAQELPLAQEPGRLHKNPIDLPRLLGDDR